MNDRLTSVVSIDELARVCEAERTESQRLFTAILSTRLLEARGGYVSFRHDLFQAFFVVEQLLLSDQRPDAIASKLDTPRLEQYCPLLLEAVVDEEFLGALLLSSKAAHSAISDCLSGRHGSVALTVATRLLERIVTECIGDFRSGAVTWHVAEGGKEIACKWTRTLTRHEKVFLRAFLLHGAADRFFTRALEFWGEFDRLVDREASRIAPTLNLRPDAANALLYEAAAINPDLPIPLVPYIRMFEKRRAEDHQKLLDAFSSAHTLVPAQLYFLCIAMRDWSLSLYDERSSIDQELAANLGGGLSALLAAAWRQSWARLRMASLDLVVGLARSLSEDMRDEVRDVVEGLESGGNVWLSTQLLEALQSLGAELEPVADHEQLARQIQDAIAEPTNSEHQRWAYGWFSAQFEPLEAISGPHYDAITSLDQADECRFLAMAALGADMAISDASYCVRKLATHAKAREERLSEAALRRWAVPPSGHLVTAQDRTAAFAFANAGLGRLRLGHCEPDGPVAMDELAWSHFGRLFYVLGTKNDDATSDGLADASWEILSSELLMEALTPLYHLVENIWLAQLGVEVSVEDGQRYLGAFPPPLAHRWPGRVATMFEELAARLDGLPPIKWAHDPSNRFVIEGVGKYGGPDATDLLRPLVDDATLGRSALAAMRALDRRHGSGR